MTPTPLIQPAPFGGGIRCTTYRFKSGAFGGLTYDLTLKYDLVANYFALVQGHYLANARGAAASSVRVIRDPFGTGGLGTSSGADVIRLQRNSTGLNDWRGSITIVENVSAAAADGFTLVDALSVSMAGSPASVPQDQTATSAAWTTLGQVVPFGGPFGGGSNVAAGSGQHYHDAAVRLHPSGTTTINLRRDQAAAGNLVQAGFTIYVVEWGTNWTVQSVNVTGTNAGDGLNATGEYDTGAITSAARDNSWVWMAGTSDANDDADESARSLVATLGDGVNQNANETTVAVGQEHTGVSKDAYVYVMEHSSLAVDYRFKSDADSANPLAQTVDGPSVAELYDTTANPETVEGARIPLVYASVDSIEFRRGIQWPHYSSPTAMDIYRQQTGSNWVGWVQSVDLGGL